jgi:DNA-binding transcriptional regulator YdaS (Cro superfamily)
MDISEIIRRGGGASKIAHAIGRHHTSILGWTRVPAEHARAVETLTGIPKHELRPDLWDRPDAIADAADAAASTSDQREVA